MVGFYHRSLIAMLLQAMCAKLGIVTGQDLAQATRARVGPKLAALLWITTELAIMATEIAEVIGKGLGVPIVSLTAEEALEHFGFLARFFGADCPASSAQTREQLGWQPAETFDSGIRKTVEWYLANGEWVRHVQSGAYREWIGTQYGDAGAA